MGDVTLKPLGIVTSAAIEEEEVHVLKSNTTLNEEYFSDLTERISRNSLLAALAALVGPKQGKTGGYLTDSVRLTTSGNTFSIESTENVFDGVGWISGFCPWRSASGNMLEERAALFGILASDGIVNDVPFANATGVTYYIGIACATYPTTIAQNPRTGAHEYVKEKTIIGVKVKPATVTDTGIGLAFTLPTDAIIGTASLAGRTAIVYKVDDPQGDTATAIASGTVVWTGAANQVSTTYLGQSSPSTTPADYAIVLTGPVCSNVPAVANVNGLAQAGTILGGAAPTVNGDAQDLIPTMAKLLQDVLVVSAPSKRSTARGVYKVKVTGKAGEVGVNQIEVTAPGGAPVFAVDENGAITGASLTLSGLLTVSGGIDLDGSDVTGGGAFHGEQFFATPVADTDPGVQVNNAAGVEKVRLIPGDSATDYNGGIIRFARPDLSANNGSMIDLPFAGESLLKITNSDAGLTSWVRVIVDGVIEKEENSADWALQVNSAADRILYVRNIGAGGASLYVDNTVSCGVLACTSASASGLAGFSATGFYGPMIETSIASAAAPGYQYSGLGETFKLSISPYLGGWTSAANPAGVYPLPVAGTPSYIQPSSVDAIAIRRPITFEVSWGHTETVRRMESISYQAWVETASDVLTITVRKQIHDGSAAATTVATVTVPASPGVWQSGTLALNEDMDFAYDYWVTVQMTPSVNAADTRIGPMRLNLLKYAVE